LNKFSPYTNTTDEQLLQQYYSSKNNSFLGALLERYTLLLLGVCMKYLKDRTEAEEAVQQVYLKTLDTFPKYQVTHFKSWVYIVAKNHCLAQIKTKKHFIDTDNSHIQIVANEEDTEQHLEKNYTLDLMHESIALLPIEQKNCVTLFYLEKKTYTEIEQATGYSFMQVKSYIQNGKRNLKITMQKKLGGQ
jgi:RNA polymerase sigma factor (sigma-70 family)